MSTVTVTPTVEAGNVPPRIRLNVASSDATSATITRLNPDGRTVVVRTPDGGPLTISGGVGLMYDYESPFGQQVLYSSLESPNTTSAMVTVDAPSVWLIHPGVPALSVPVLVGEFGARSFTTERGVFRPMGRDTAVVVTDGSRKAAEYDLTLVTRDDVERANLAAILSDASTLLLNVPVSKGFGVDAEYISVGDVSEVRVTRIAAEQMRRWQLSCSVVARPAGGSQSQRTFADILVDNATFGDLMVKYDSFFDLLAGP